MIASAVFIVLLMMGAESTLAGKNKYDCLKLHHVGYLIELKKKFRFLNSFLQESLDLRSLMILIILFCNLKICKL
jgi:hypothetical protein